MLFRRLLAALALPLACAAQPPSPKPDSAPLSTTAERFQAFLAKPEERTAAQQAVAAFSDGLIE